ncbi:MAG: hypothetical protein IJV44_01695 [Prevotella sp.]|nr:hypothetical protein [Prevotella sp.]
MKEIKSIILYLDSLVAIEHLTDEQAGILIKAVLRYAKDGQQLETSDTALIALFSILCAQVDRDHKKYEERCERNSANARKRRASQGQIEQSHPIASDGKPPQAAGCLNNNDNNSDIDNENSDDTANAIIIRSQPGVSFDTVREMYGKVAGDINKAKALWGGLSDQDHAAILAYIPGYVASTPEIRYRKNLNNFLSERYWENHPINNRQDGIEYNPRIGEQEKRKRDVYSTAVKAINNLTNAAEVPGMEPK